MVFTVIYRDTNGNLAKEQIEASNRSDCYRQLRIRNICPLQVTKGGEAPAIHEYSRRSYFTIGILFMAIGGMLIFWFCRDSGGTNERITTPSNKQVKNVKLAHRIVTKPESSSNEPMQKVKMQVRFLKNKDGSKMMLKPNDVVGSNVFETAYGTVRMLAAPTTSAGSPVFKNNVHAMMASYIQPGVDMPPPEHVPNEEALAACLHPIEISYDDSPSVKNEKEMVEAMRLELKEYLSQGGSADSYFRKLQQRQESEAEAVREVRRHVNELINDDKVEDAVIALKEFNKYLNSKGMPNLRIKRLNRYMKALEQKETPKP